MKYLLRQFCLIGGVFLLGGLPVARAQTTSIVDPNDPTASLHDGQVQYSDSANIDVQPRMLSLRADRDRICAGGGNEFSHTTLHVTLKNFDGTTIANQSVYFSLPSNTPATLSSSSGTTNANGEASVKLSSGSEYGTIVQVKASAYYVQAFAGVLIEPPRGIASVEAAAPPLLAGGQSKAKLSLKLFYPDQAHPVTGHIIAWSIVGATRDDGTKEVAPFSGYGSISDYSGSVTNRPAGEYWSNYIKGPKAGPVYFEAVDMSVSEKAAP